MLDSKTYPCPWTVLKMSWSLSALPSILSKLVYFATLVVYYLKIHTVPWVLAVDCYLIPLCTPGTNDSGERALPEPGQLDATGGHPHGGRVSGAYVLMR